MAFGAHPDDLEYYAGGSLCQYARQGGEITAVLATDGELGGRRANLGTLRREEQRRAAAILGYREVVFLGFPDRGLAAASDLPDAIEATLHRVRPDVVATFDAERPLPPYVHPDHQAVGRAVLTVWRALGSPAQMYLFHTRAPNAVIDVSPVWEVKLAALRAFHSQRSGEQLPRGLRPVWRWLATGSGFPLPPRRERFRRLEMPAQASS